MNEQNEIRGDELADVEEAHAEAPELDPLTEPELEDWYQRFIATVYGK